MVYRCKKIFINDMRVLIYNSIIDLIALLFNELSKSFRLWSVVIVDSQCFPSIYRFYHIIRDFRMDVVYSFIAEAIAMQFIDSWTHLRWQFFATAHRYCRRRSCCLLLSWFVMIVGGANINLEIERPNRISVKTRYVKRIQTFCRPL